MMRPPNGQPRRQSLPPILIVNDEMLAEEAIADASLAVMQFSERVIGVLPRDFDLDEINLLANLALEGRIN
jgi:hypothetical protein